MATKLRRAALDRVAVVPMRRRHLRQVLAIEERVYPRPWSPGLFTAELEREDSRHYLVAVVPRESGVGPGWPRVVVGYAGIMTVTGEAHVTTVAVDPDQHRRKVGSRLVHALLRTARQTGATAATLEVRMANRGAQRLYQAFGFAPVGVRPGYYAETGEDALVMWIHDLQGEEMRRRLADQAARLEQPAGASGHPDHAVPWVREGLDLPGGDSDAGGDPGRAGGHRDAGGDEERR